MAQIDSVKRVDLRQITRATKGRTHLQWTLFYESIPVYAIFLFTVVHIYETIIESVERLLRAGEIMVGNWA